MSETTEQLLQKAMLLSDKDRSALAEALVESLRSMPDSSIDAAWEAEIARRVRDLDTHAVETVPWSSVREQLFRGVA